jgi:uncharacterized protein (UPF0332 family)
MITPDDLLTLAEKLIRGAVEAEWRSAVSRAYYAAFHKARLLLKSVGFAVPRGDQAHAYLWLRLCNCGDPQTIAAGSDLNALRGDRNIADYQVDANFFLADAQVQVQTARRILQLLDAAAVDPTRSQITNAMKVYEKTVLKQITWTP